MQSQIKLQKTADMTYLEAINIFRGFKGRKKVRFMFWRPKEGMRSKYSVFSGSKERNKVCLVYLKCKLQQNSSG